jgi:hypothetical protein
MSAYFIAIFLTWKTQCAAGRALIIFLFVSCNLRWLAQKALIDKTMAMIIYFDVRTPIAAAAKNSRCFVLVGADCDTYPQDYEAMVISSGARDVPGRR